MHAYQEYDWETRVLDKCAIRLGDIVKIEPVSGSSRSFAINRISLDIVSDNFRGETGIIVKKIPSLRTDTIHLRMERMEQRNYLGSAIYRFQLKTMNGRPFWHNGSLVFSIILTDGDILEIGHNRLHFNKKRDKSNDEMIDFNQYHKLICSTVPILIEGKTGTGKSTLARQIHEHSGREGEFVHINLSAFSENLMESELFGHVRGAFTGALNDKKGAILRANKGTLFLDEIDSTSLAVQIKLLLFLDNYAITPVGGSTSRKVDCRIILASGSNLVDLVEQKKLRLDFFYRISVGHKIKLPSLKDRPSLIHGFCEEFEARNGVTIEKRLKDFFQGLEWSGNYRQLKGHLERKKLMAAGQKIIWGEDDEALLNSDPLKNDLPGEVISLGEMKDKYCIKVYYQCYKNLGVAAKRLSISEKCLRAVLKRKGLK